VNAAAAAGCEAIARSQQSPRTQNYSGASKRDGKNGDKKMFYFFFKRKPIDADRRGEVPARAFL